MSSDAVDADPPAGPPADPADPSGGPLTGDALRDGIAVGLRRFIASVVLFNQGVSQRLGLGASDAQFLTLLEVHGPLTPGQLAAHTGLSTGSVTGVVDRLERAGLAHRTRDATDRRKVTVARDEAAISERLAPAYAEQARWLDAVLRHRSPDDLRAIGAFLADLTSGPPAPDDSA